MKIEHVAIYSNNLEQLKSFYVKYFAGVAGSKYENKAKGFESYFISFADGARLEIMQQVNVKEHRGNSTTGLAHLAFSVGDRTRVDELTKKIVADGYQIVSGPRKTGDGYYESCVLDPEGNSVEITE